MSREGSGLDGSTRRVRILYTNSGKTESVVHVALYARVLTDRQDHDRQIRELEEFVGEEYLDASVDRFADIISGTGDEGGAQYHRLRDAIADGEVDVVRASRSEVSRREKIQHGVETGR